MYIHPETLSNQSTYAPGLLPLTEDQFKMYLQYNGFVRITSTSPVQIEPDIEAWESWKAEEEAKPEPMPSESEQLRADIDYIALMMGVEL